MPALIENTKEGKRCFFLSAASGHRIRAACIKVMAAHSIPSTSFPLFDFFPGGLLRASGWHLLGLPLTISTGH